MRVSSLRIWGSIFSGAIPYSPESSLMEMVDFGIFREFFSRNREDK